MHVGGAGASNTSEVYIYYSAGKRRVRVPCGVVLNTYTHTRYKICSNTNSEQPHRKCNFPHFCILDRRSQFPSTPTFLFSASRPFAECCRREHSVIKSMEMRARALGLCYIAISRAGSHSVMPPPNRPPRIVPAQLINNFVCARAQCSARNCDVCHRRRAVLPR